MKNAGIRVSLLIGLLLVIHHVDLFSADYSYGKIFRMTVNSQKEFEKIPSTIYSYAKEGYKDIRLIVSKGIYYYDEGTFTLKGFNFPEVSVTIQGEEAIIIPKGNDYKNGDDFSKKITPNTVFIADDFSVVDLYSDMYQAVEIIEVIDEKTGLCRIKGNSVITGNAEGMFITIPQWYKAHTYRVTDIKDGYIYFSVDNLSKDKWNRYSVNYDYTLHKDLPRFRLFNAGDGLMSIKNNKMILSKQYDMVHSCGKCSFLRIWNSTFKRFSLSGFHFIGNCYNGSTNALIDFKESTSTEFAIFNCEFTGIKSQLMLIQKTNNVCFKLNVVQNCYGFGIASYNGCANTAIIGNVFHNNGRDFQQDYSVCCMGENYYIANNKFYDFPYSAIRVGLHYQQDHNHKCNGIVEKNELYYTRDFFNDYKKHTLMDGGAIYVGTVNDGAVIRYNYIHDYIGMEGNRGIFCDDGAGNVEIYENVVTNVPNCYAIESRRVQSMDKNFEYTNRNVVIRDNIIEGNYRFEARDESCILGDNVIVNPTDSCLVKVMTTEGTDIVLDKVKRNKAGKIKLTRKQKRLARKSIPFGEVKKWL